MTIEEMTQSAMLITGGFEGSDPWANITGNFDAMGLTCGQLGKTFADGEQQKLVKTYLTRHGSAELLTLMPASGASYINAVNASTAAGTTQVKAWSGTSSKVRSPEGPELARFWKSAKMVQVQKEHALANETQRTSTWLTAWAGSGSFHEFALFFDIAAQNGSLKGVDRAAVTTFAAGNAKAAAAGVIAWCRTASSSLAGYKDTRKNAVVWDALLAHASAAVIDLFLLAYLRAKKANAVYVADVLNRKGTLALGEGWIHGGKWDLLDELGLAGASPHPVVIEPDVPTPVAPPAPAAVPATEALFRVSADSGLRLRRTPSSKNMSNVITTLPAGSLVRFVGASADPAWWEVRANVSGNSVTGFMASGYLSPVASPVAPPPAAPPAALTTPNSPAPTAASSVVAVHLPIPSGHVVRRNERRWAFPLNEPGLVQRTGTTSTTKRNQLGQIIQWLNATAHARYLPSGGNTYCNIYAYDYCYCAGVYLPRVWWTDAAIARLTQGHTVNPAYGSTVDEITANGLHGWFRSWAQRFGWRQTISLDALQNHANQGGVSIIVAKNSQGHGHITAVVPEVGANQAARDTTGNVLRPLESQAGSTNYQYVTKSTKWWTPQKYTAAFWMHD